MRLLLIRHGQTPSNVVGALDTAYPGAELTPLGQAQAAAIPAHLSSLPGGDDVTGIYVSRLVRTQLTAAPLAAARGIDPLILPGLEETSAGDLEMRTHDDAIRAYVDIVGAWLNGDLERPMPGGPTGQDFLDRFDAAVADIAVRHRDGGTAVVVSHGSAIRLWSALRSHNVDAPTSGSRHLQNTGACAMTGDPATGWELTAWHGEPLGGTSLEDHLDRDPTGEADLPAIAVQGRGGSRK